MLLDHEDQILAIVDAAGDIIGCLLYTSVLGQLAAADVDGQVYPIKDVYRRCV